jgi:8-oxo-dGTP pyrophosphatase MutT (NUDIX family)
MGGEANPEALMREISEELGLLRNSIAERNVSAIEAHTERTRDLLTDLRPVLIRQGPRQSPELLKLRDTVRGCVAVIAHIRRTFRALHGLYRSVLDPLSGPGTYEVRR